MTIDPRVITAVEQAVEEARESPALAQKIVAWLDSLAAGNTRLSDRDSTDRHLRASLPTGIRVHGRVRLIQCHSH